MSGFSACCSLIAVIQQSLNLLAVFERGLENYGGSGSPGLFPELHAGTPRLDAPAYDRRDVARMMGPHSAARSKGISKARN